MWDPIERNNVKIYHGAHYYVLLRIIELPRKRTAASSGMQADAFLRTFFTSSKIRRNT